MSQENIELVRRAIDLFNRGRIPEDVADDFEMDWSNSIGPHRGVYRGREGLNEVFESFRHAWDGLRWDIQQVIDLEGERALVVNRVRMRGRTSRAEAEATGAQVWTIRNGKLKNVKLYQSKAEAFEARGLSEQRCSRRLLTRARYRDLDVGAT
jgi:ketosteroid isomerase-like protein